jgi:hypothetical protein
MPYSTPSFLNVAVLHYNVSTKTIQSNLQVALSWLMHSIHCGSTIFPYKALLRRSAQETLIGCVELQNKKLEGSEHSSCTYIMAQE